MFIFFTESGIVTNLNATNVSSNEIEMKWRKPTCPNGDLVNYTVQISSPPTLNVSAVDFVSATSYRIHHLKPGERKIKFTCS